MKKSLMETNPYLKNSKDLKADIAAAVAASSAIEGVRLSRTASATKPAKKTVKGVARRASS